MNVYKGVEIPNCQPYNKDRGEFQCALVTSSGDVSSAEYTHSYTPSMPTIMKNRKIIGSDPRRCKVFIPPSPLRSKRSFGSH